MNPNDYNFPVFKGLQKPLEFMGLRGRFMTMAAAGVGISFLGYCLAAIIAGQLAGLIFLVASVIISLGTIYLKQRQGLHSKKRCRDTLVYQYLFIRK